MGGCSACCFAVLSCLLRCVFAAESSQDTTAQNVAVDSEVERARERERERERECVCVCVCVCGTHTYTHTHTTTLSGEGSSFNRLLSAQQSKTNTKASRGRTSNRVDKTHKKKKKQQQVPNPSCSSLGLFLRFCLFFFEGGRVVEVVWVSYSASFTVLMSEFVSLIKR